MKETSRRRFVKTSLAAAAGTGILSTIRATGASPVSFFGGIGKSVVGANDKVRFGIIGPGGRGKALLRRFLDNEEVECAVVCDVDDSRNAEAVKLVEDKRGNRPVVVKDFRKVIDRNDLDFVIVATPDHWHALPTIYACESGKDVYVEKPLATSIGEGRAMVDAARQYGRVVQMGTQWKSSRHFGDAVDFVHSGKLGRIRQVRLWAHLSWIRAAGNPADSDPPEGVDYDMWLGPAPKVPFNPARFHFTFRWFWDYAGGLMTDWGVHLLNIALWAMKYPNPRSVTSTGGKYVLIDDIGETPDTQMAVYEFPDFILTWEHQMVGGHGIDGRPHGIAFYGTEGTLLLDAGSWEVVPEKDKSLEAVKAEKGDDGQQEHIRNFLDCMKTRENPAEDIEVGHSVSAVAHLGNIAFRTQTQVKWDPEKERVKEGNWKAARLVTQPYRSPWKLPGVAAVSSGVMTSRGLRRRSFFKCCPKQRRAK